MERTATGPVASSASSQAANPSRRDSSSQLAAGDGSHSVAPRERLLQYWTGDDRTSQPGTIRSDRPASDVGPVPCSLPELLSALWRGELAPLQLRPAPAFVFFPDPNSVMDGTMVSDVALDPPQRKAVS